MVQGSATAFGYTASPAGRTYWFALRRRRPPARRSTRRALRRAARPTAAAAARDATPAAGLVEPADGAIMVINAMEMPPHPLAHRTGPACRRRGPRGLTGDRPGRVDGPGGRRRPGQGLRDLPDPERAFAAYERHRRPRVEHNITVSGGLPRHPHALPPGPGPPPSRRAGRAAAPPTGLELPAAGRTALTRAPLRERWSRRPPRAHESAGGRARESIAGAAPGPDRSVQPALRQQGAPVRPLSRAGGAVAAAVALVLGGGTATPAQPASPAPPAAP